MKKRVILVLLVACLFLVSGFAGCDLLKLSKGPPTMEQRGITATFNEGEPPLEKIYENQEFFVGLDLSNSMTFPMRAKITIRDTLPKPNYGGIEDAGESRVVTIQAAEFAGDEFITGYESVTFPIEGTEGYMYKNIPPGSIQNTHFIVELETKYNKLMLTPSICVKKGNAELEDISCPDKETIEEKDIPGGGHSPIALTKLEKTVYPLAGNSLVSVNLLLYFKNLGTGNIPSKDKSIKLERVKVYAGDLAFVCYPGVGSKVTLRDGEAVVRCEQKFNLGEADFSNYILDIQYSYNYKVSKVIGPIQIVSLQPPQRGIPGEEEAETGEEELGGVKEEVEAEEEIAEKVIEEQQAKEECLDKGYFWKDGVCSECRTDADCKTLGYPKCDVYLGVCISEEEYYLAYYGTD